MYTYAHMHMYIHTYIYTYTYIIYKQGPELDFELLVQGLRRVETATAAAQALVF
jgi:hypothetical protein